MGRVRLSPSVEIREKILRAVVVGDEIDGLAVWSKMGVADDAVEGESEDFGGAAGGGRDGEMFAWRSRRDEGRAW